MRNLRICLARRPAGEVSEADFSLVEAEAGSPGAGEVLVAGHFLSLDPYMRMRMDAGKSYAPPVEVGEVMVGGGVGEVLESRAEGFGRGDFVTGRFGWQQFAVVPAGGLRKLDPKLAPISTALGVVGMPGVTAWYGLLQIGNPQPGETVVVSAAAGAVGSVVGQVAKIRGCRAIGIAGGPAKCRYVVEELGFDACVDYKSAAFEYDLKAAAPSGIDVYFENVGGRVLDAVLPLLNAFARIPFCGYVSEYDRGGVHAIRHLRQLLVSRARLQGFIISEHMEFWPQALAELAGWLSAGRLRYRETVTEGLENAPRAFVGMLRGENLGKQLVKLR